MHVNSVLVRASGRRRVHDAEGMWEGTLEVWGTIPQFQEVAERDPNPLGTGTG